MCEEKKTGTRPADHHCGKENRFTCNTAGRHPPSRVSHAGNANLGSYGEQPSMTRKVLSRVDKVAWNVELPRDSIEHRTGKIEKGQLKRKGGGEDEPGDSKKVSSGFSFWC